MKKLIYYLKCNSSIELLSGLHIGGSKDSLKIGGIDNPVIRHPISGSPFIPGSTLKGRFRMALELKYKDYTDRGEPSEDANHESIVVKLFGSSNSRTQVEPNRLIFRDCNLMDGYDSYVEGEEKVELKMNRHTMAGSKSGPRTMERIPEGAKFNFLVTIRVFEGDDIGIFKSRLEEARKITELEFLGGSGSRGYGQVKIEPFNFEKVEI
jgi:CRISPR-associated protein Csm3